jgi:hypothetical protein
MPIFQEFSGLKRGRLFRPRWMVPVAAQGQDPREGERIAKGMGRPTRNPALRERSSRGLDGLYVIRNLEDDIPRGRANG